jgi:dienelactone hydrolase
MPTASAISWSSLGRIVIDPDSHDADILAIREVASGSLKQATVMNDTRALLSILDGDPVVRRGSMGTIGYCQGGRFCVLAAETFLIESRRQRRCSVRS